MYIIFKISKSLLNREVMFRFLESNWFHKESNFEIWVKRDDRRKSKGCSVFQCLIIKSKVSLRQR